jgi:hypothetical protein
MKKQQTMLTIIIILALLGLAALVGSTVYEEGIKENKKVVEGQFDMFNFKLAEIAHEIDKINLNELTPIDALNTLMKIKEKMK